MPKVPKVSVQENNHSHDSITGAVQGNWWTVWHTEEKRDTESMLGERTRTWHNKWLMKSNVCVCDGGWVGRFYIPTHPICYLWLQTLKASVRGLADNKRAKRHANLQPKTFTLSVIYVGLSIDKNFTIRFDSQACDLIQLWSRFESILIHLDLYQIQCVNFSQAKKISLN